MLEIVKKQSSAVRQIDTQKGKRSPNLTGQETATKTSAVQSGDFELAVVRQ